MWARKILRGIVAVVVGGLVLISAAWIIVGLLGMLTCFSAALPERISIRLAKEMFVTVFWTFGWVYWPGLIVALPGIYAFEALEEEE